MRTGYTIVLVCLISSASFLMTGCGEDSPGGPPGGDKSHAANHSTWLFVKSRPCQVP